MECFLVAASEGKEEGRKRRRLLHVGVRTVLLPFVEMIVAAWDEGLFYVLNFGCSKYFSVSTYHV